MQLLTRGDESFRWCCEEGREFSGFIVRRFHARWGEMADHQSLLSPCFPFFRESSSPSSSLSCIRFALFLLLETLFLTNKGAATISQRLE